jgi:hypothetical protein
LGEPVDTALLVFSEKGAASSFVDTDPYIKAVRGKRYMHVAHLRSRHDMGRETEMA